MVIKGVVQGERREQAQNWSQIRRNGSRIPKEQGVSDIREEL